MNFRSLEEIRGALHAGKLTCVELVRHYLHQIERHKNLNAFLEVFEKEAMEKASALDKKISSGEKCGKLAGMVVSIKDVLAYHNHKVSAGSKILKGFESIYSGTAVQRLVDEDAIIIGRTNCDEFAMGSSNENSAYGPVKNGLDDSLVPGGSSGGAAVSVQMEMCLAALGTDTGGSVRQPASFCGVVGMKPTYGRVSRHGLIAYASSFDQVGIFSNNVKDCATILEVIAGPDEFDATAAQTPADSYSDFFKTEKLRLAYFPEVIEHEKVNAGVRKKIEEIFEKLRANGHSIEPVEFGLTDYLVPAYYVLTTAEASSNLSRFDGIRYGHKSKDATDLESTYRMNRSEGFGEEVKRRIMLGTFVLSAGFYDAYYSRGQKVRRLLRDKTNSILEDFDFIISPTTPTTAFKLGENVKDPIEMYLADIFTVLAPLAGLPAISIPAGNHENGMPVGLQLIAGKWMERKVFSSAHQIEAILN